MRPKIQKKKKSPETPAKKKEGIRVRRGSLYYVVVVVRLVETEKFIDPRQKAEKQ